MRRDFGEFLGWNLRGGSAAELQLYFSGVFSFFAGQVLHWRATALLEVLDWGCTVQGICMF